MQKLHLTLTTILLGACIVLAIFLQRSCTKINHANNFISMYNASQARLDSIRNKLGQQTATTALLYGSINNLKALNATKDSTLGQLQKLVTRLTISATLLNTATSNQVHTGSTVTAKDTVIKDHISYVYPQYKTNFKNKWEAFDITANKDTFLINYSIFNEYRFTQKWQRSGFLKPKQAVVSVLNLNPHSSTTDIRSFIVKPPKANRLKNIVTGIGIGVAAGFLIFKK